jgi:hypothetical protein
MPELFRHLTAVKVMFKKFIISTLAVASFSYGGEVIASEAVIQQMPAIGGGVIKQIDGARLLREGTELMSTTAEMTTSQASNSMQNDKIAQIVQRGVNNQAAIMQSGNGRASILQNGQGNSAFVIQR